MLRSSLAVWAIIVISCAGQPQLDTDNGSKDSGKFRPARSLFKPGEIVTVKPSKTRPTFLYTDDDARLEYTRAVNSGGGQPVWDMIKHERIIELPDETRVEILEARDISCRVKVVGGKCDGRTGIMDDIHLGGLQRQDK